MFDSLGGLPAHPLLVHIPVAFVPLAAVGVLVLALRPSLAKTFGPVVAGVTLIGFLGALLAVNTGEALEEQFASTGQTPSPQLEDHAAMGDRAQVVIGLFFLVVMLWLLFAWWRRRVGEEAAVAKVRKPGVVAIVLTALAVVVGAWATVTVMWTGHSGAKSVWEQSDS